MGLDTLINEKGLKKGKVAEYLGISRNAFWKKTRHRLSFRDDEINKLSSLLGVSKREIEDAINN